MKKTEPMNNKQIMEFLQNLSDAHDQRTPSFDAMNTINIGAVVRLLGEIAVRIGEPKMNGLYWRPIETYPRPEKTDWILVWGKAEFSLYYASHEVSWSPFSKKFRTPTEEDITASHWMPMPEGPQP